MAPVTPQNTQDDVDSSVGAPHDGINECEDMEMDGCSEEDNELLAAARRFMPFKGIVYVTVTQDQFLDYQQYAKGTGAPSESVVEPLRSSRRHRYCLGSSPFSTFTSRCTCFCPIQDGYCGFGFSPFSKFTSRCTCFSSIQVEHVHSRSCGANPFEHWHVYR